MEIELCGVNINVEDKLYEKLVLMAKRVSNDDNPQDACLNNSGNEGDGKTNLSILEAAIIQKLTGFPIVLFFSTNSALKYCQVHNKTICIIDEPAADALASDANTSNFKDFLRLMTMMRKHRNFMLVNMAKFWKFPEFLVVDRALGMVHIHSRNGTDYGRILYIRKRNLEALWNAYKKQNKREFAKLKSFGGRIPYVMDKIFDKLDIRVENVEHSTLKDYEDEKDKSIANIGVKVSKKELIIENKMRVLKWKIATRYKEFGLTQEQVCKMIGIDRKTLKDWQILGGRLDFEGGKDANINISMSKVEKIDPDLPEEDTNTIDDDENAI